jgi:beta-mannanase
MRAVPGAQFRFVWNPDASAFDTAGYNESLAWPGASYVDAVGIDAYDQSWASPQTPTNAWNQTTAPTLVAAHNFAAAQGRPLAVCEWGVAIRTDGHGLGDDPLYVTNMINWMKNAPDDVVYESYFDANDGTTNSIITGGSFPSSLSAFRGDL